MYTAHGVVPLPIYSKILIDEKNLKEKYVGFSRTQGDCEDEPFWLIYRESTDVVTKLTTIEYASNKYNCCWSVRDSYFNTIP